MIRAGDVARLPGTRIQNRCAVCSTGIDTIDSLIGGGLPLASVYVLSERNSRRYAPFLERYFVAEGLANGHEIFVNRPHDTDPDDFLSQLPAPLKASAEASASAGGSQAQNDDDFRIAWRYKTMPVVESALSAKVCQLNAHISHLRTCLLVG